MQPKVWSNYIQWFSERFLMVSFDDIQDAFDGEVNQDEMTPLIGLN